MGLYGSIFAGAIPTRTNLLVSAGSWQEQSPHPEINGGFIREYGPLESMNFCILLSYLDTGYANNYMQIWVERGTDFDGCEWTHMYKAPLLWRPCGTSVRARYTHQWQEKSPQLWCHCIATLLPIAGVDLCGYSFGDWELTQFHWKLLVIFLTSCSWHHWRPRPMILFKAMNCHSCNCWPSGFAQVILYIELTEIYLLERSGRDASNQLGVYCWLHHIRTISFRVCKNTAAGTNITHRPRGSPKPRIG